MRTLTFVTLPETGVGGRSSFTEGLILQGCNAIAINFGPKLPLPKLVARGLLFPRVCGRSRD